MWCGSERDGKGRAQKHTPSILARITMRINWTLDILLPLKFQIERTMKKLWCTLGRISVWGWMLGISILIGVALFLIITFNKAYFNTSWEIDTELAADFGSFIGGFVGTIFSLVGIFVVAYTFDKQFRRTNEMFEEQSHRSEENFKRQFRQTNQIFEEQNKQNRKSEATNNFLKMIDCYNTIVEEMKLSDQISGRLVFSQLRRIIKERYDVICMLSSFEEMEAGEDQAYNFAYIISYYWDPSRTETVEDGLLTFLHTPSYFPQLDEVQKKNNRRNIKRIVSEFSAKTKTHPFLSYDCHEYLSHYFRTIYSAIRIVDSDSDLILAEKRKLISILRSQLSNSELYLLDLHVRSGVDRAINYRWEEFINSYELFSSIPKGYLYRDRSNENVERKNDAFIEFYENAKVIVDKLNRCNGGASIKVEPCDKPDERKYNVRFFWITTPIDQKIYGSRLLFEQYEDGNVGIYFHPSRKREPRKELEDCSNHIVSGVNPMELDGSYLNDLIRRYLVNS
jgi:hypothetical protein